MFHGVTKEEDTYLGEAQQLVIKGYTREQVIEKVPGIAPFTTDLDDLFLTWAPKYPQNAEKKIYKSTAWGDTYKARSPALIKKQMYKKKLVTGGTDSCRFIDHQRTFAQKPKGKRGPASYAQTFLVSFLYKKGISKEELEGFLLELSDNKLRGHFEETQFHGQEAWQIVIVDSDVNLNDAVNHAKELPH